ncbi:MAG: isoleucine--tRNA ligase [Kiritimatiellia bacterium]
MYTPVSNKPDLPAMERAILDFWEKNRTFERTLEARRGAPEFVFYDGPPFATGLPHYGHLLAGTIKDVVPRYQCMRGYFVERRFGWDCHGLPVEYEVEQELDISGRTEIEKIGVAVFNEKCRSIVLRYTREWREIVSRMGRWVDFDNDYKTMDPKYMESIWWVFRALWDRGLIYEGSKVLPYCPRCATPLSNFETNQGYREVTDPAITVRFRALDEPNAYFLAWTTTPWTLPSNMALAVGPDIDYVRVQEKEAAYYLAENRLSEYYPRREEIVSIQRVKGADLADRPYEPLFPYFASRREAGAFRVITADFVSTEEGTGIVHMAPGFGEDDHRVGLEQGIPVVCPVDVEGRFTSEVPDYSGRRVKETDAEIVARLKQEGKLVHRGTVQHSYPHCWRCETPLIYRAISTWFVRVEQIKDRLIEANKHVNWVPAHLKTGRFGKWLGNAKDWAISRNRYWGTPLPVWRSSDGEETICIGSIQELEELSGQHLSDLHKHYVDAIEIPSRQGKGMLRRVPEVLDCWFESGAMPYAQAHYPFENRERFEKYFPADFIAEGLDQTRGWFYTLMVLSVALFDKPAFKNVVVNGLVLAEDGKKMSKRLKNYPDPSYMIETYGADALRLYLLKSPVVRAEDLRFSESGVRDLVRNVLLPLWNAYSFFVTYANIDGWTASKATKTKRVGTNVLDCWISSALESMIAQVMTAMDGYDLQRAVPPIVDFVDKLTNWYIRRSRRRFWKSSDDDDKQQAYETLYHVLLRLSVILAPFVPFVSEAIYRNLRREDMPDSVHLCSFPVPDESRHDPDLVQEMTDVMTVVHLGRQLRTQHNLKIRQPLATLHVVSRDRGLLDRLRTLAEIVADELNVKEISFSTEESALAELRAKPDYRRLGPRLGSRMKTVAAAIAHLGKQALEALAAGQEVEILLDGAQFTLEPWDVVLERIPRPNLVVAADGPIVVALDTKLTPALVEEGLAREFVNKLQNMRKESNLDVTARIRVVYDGDAEARAAIERYAEYICRETLCVSLACDAAATGDGRRWDLNGHPCSIAISPV